MNIGYDGSRISVKQRTGTENYSYQLLKNLLRIDKKNTYRVYSREALQDEALKGENSKEIVINYPRLWTQWGLASEVIRHRPDILFIPAHTLPVIRHPKLKTIVTIHDLGAEYLPQYHKFPGKLYLNKSTEYAASQASHLIAVSEFTKRDLVRKMDVDPDRITVIYEGVDLSEISSSSKPEIDKVKRKYSLNNDYILFVGTIQPRKNLVKLIEAYAQLQPKNIDLVLAGGKGWLSDEIYQSPERLEISDRVKFLGYIDEEDKAALYTGACITTLVSHFEGFGLPMVESMACGTPVVAANASCLPEIIGNAGILVDPNDVHSIADGLREGISNHKLRQQLIENGFAQAKKFSWKSTAVQTLKLFEQVGSKHE